MDGSGARGRVDAWLRDNSAALELRTAAVFAKRLGTRNVDHARYYVDRDADGFETFRETDVVARAVGPDAAVTAIVECKAPKGGDPWVVLTSTPDGDRSHEFLSSLTPRWSEGSFDLRSLDALGHDIVAPLGRPIGYHIASASSKEDGRNLAWDAVRQAVDAALGFALRPTGTAAVGFHLPIVVTTAPLFAVHLDLDSGSPVVTPVTAMAMLAQVPLMGRPLGGQTSTVIGQMGVWVTNESELERIASELLSAAQGLRRRAGS